ncbi:MAG: 4-phosphoerythronate dehydrogenase [Ignavibacteriaceae bacterium]|nr:4-phosphoerythronate dehydrogenase [Ignavibacteriaceae bacterium]
MNLIVDENIAFAQEAFSRFGNAILVDGRTLTNKNVKDADVLLIRSITKVDAELLRESKVQFVGTATIGTDHIDLDYLKSKNISFADAKGCNADSVAEYVFTALLKITSEKNISLNGKTIGVVGIGNIGSRVVLLAESLGMKVIKNDPPLERKRVGKNYVSFDEVLKADIITLHVPLSFEGVDKTFHLLNENNLKEIKKDVIIINTSRGAVIDNTSLLNETIRKDFNLILDVWEDEPLVNISVLAKTKIASAHIAGYSFEGKVNGTKIIYDALCKFTNTIPEWSPELPLIERKELELSDCNSDEERLYKLFSSIYVIEKDDASLREISNYKLNEQAGYFDLLRKTYPVRREFSNFTVHISETEKHLKTILESFRFKVRMI